MVIFHICASDIKSETRDMQYEMIQRSTIYKSKEDIVIAHSFHSMTL